MLNMDLMDFEDIDLIDYKLSIRLLLITICSEVMEYDKQG